MRSPNRGRGLTSQERSLASRPSGTLEDGIAWRRASRQRGFRFESVCFDAKIMSRNVRNVSKTCRKMSVLQPNGPFQTQHSAAIRPPATRRFHVTSFAPRRSSGSTRKMRKIRPAPHPQISRNFADFRSLKNRPIPDPLVVFYVNATLGYVPQHAGGIHDIRDS